MNPKESAYRKLKQLQKALKLRDSDTGLMGENPNLSQQLAPPQTAPKQADLELYEKMLTEALQRHFPLRESDRTELEYYRQVFHIPQEDSSAIEQRILERLPVPSTPSDSSQPGMDHLPETALTTSGPSAVTSPPAAIAAKTPTVQNKGGSANRKAVLGAAEQRLEANQPSQPGQTLPPQDQIKRSSVEAKPIDSPPGTPAADPGNPATIPPSTGFAPVTPGSQASAPHTTVQPAGMQAATPGTSPLPQVPAQPGQPTAPDSSPASAAPPDPNLEKEAVPSSSASIARKPQIDKRLAFPLIALFCGLTALGVILWTTRSSWLQQREPDPQAAAQLVKVGTERNQKGEYRDAITNFNEAIRHNPESADAYINRGYAHHQLGDLNAAANDYSQAIKLDSKSAVAYNNLSHVQSNQQQYEEAIKSAQQAIELQRNLPEAHLNLGTALLASGNADAALQKFQETLQLSATQATHAKAFNNIGNIYAARNQLEEAGRQYDQALQRDPNYAEASYNRGMIFERLENRQSAIQDYINAARLYQAQKRDRLANQAERRAEQLQQANAEQPKQSPNPNSKAI